MDKNIYLGFIGALILGIIIGSITTAYVFEQQINFYTNQINGLLVFNHTLTTYVTTPIGFDGVFNYSTQILRNNLNYNKSSGVTSLGNVPVANLYSFNNTDTNLLYPLCAVGVPINITESGAAKIRTMLNVSLNGTTAINDSVFSITVCINPKYFEKTGGLNQSQIYSQWQKVFPMK